MLPSHFRLDYSGIALLIMGSFVPWLYYSFYCSPQPRLIYLTIVCVLGIAAIIVAQWDRFSTPRHRPTRAGTLDNLDILLPFHFMQLHWKLWIFVVILSFKTKNVGRFRRWLCQVTQLCACLRCVHGTWTKRHCPHHALHH